MGNRIIHPVMPTGEQLRAFLNAGPPVEELDTDKLAAMNIGGPYRLVPGDLLEITLPPEVHTSEVDTPQETKVRVARDGTIRLPQIESFPVAGLTVEEVEAGISDHYFNSELELVNKRLTIVCTVAEHKTVTVAVQGSVAKPGMYGLRMDRLSVLSAIQAAGGIHPEKGASLIRILPSGDGGEPEEVPVRDADIPLQDVALKGGETIVVEPQIERYFAVYGLVNKSGVFPYPEPRQYNLLQVLAAAGGTNAEAAPRYATVYRRKADGEILAATFRLDGTSLLEGSNIPIKSGDVIAVEHTLGSWWRQFVSQVFGFRVSGSTSATF